MIWVIRLLRVFTYQQKKNKQTESFYIRNGFEVVIGNELFLELSLPMPKVECIEKNQFKSVSFKNFTEENNV